MVIPISKIISCLTFLPTYEQELDVKVPLEEWLSYSNATGEQHCCLCLDDIILNPLKGRPSLLPQLLEKNMTFKDNSGISHESREGLRCKNKKKPHSMWDMSWYLQIVFLKRNCIWSQWHITWNFTYFIQTWLKASLDHIRPCPKEGERRWGYSSVEESFLLARVRPWIWPRSGGRGPAYWTCCSVVILVRRLCTYFYIFVTQ